MQNRRQQQFPVTCPGNRRLQDYQTVNTVAPFTVGERYLIYLEWSFVNGDVGRWPNKPRMPVAIDLDLQVSGEFSWR